MFDRRGFLLGTAAFPFATARGQTPDSGSDFDMLLRRLAARLPDDDRFLTLAEATVRQKALVAAHGGRARLRQIGISRQGRPIELLSVGTGPRSALVVAGVHANEVVGSVTADFLARQFLEDPGLCDATGHTWHFVNPIDPDGLVRNENWLTAPLAPERMLRDFYRPAFRRQPDYSFPLREGSFAFNASPPENRAFRAAIDFARPDFLYTLHNAEFGGAFFLTSQALPALDDRLRQITAAFGLSLNPFGEPLSEIPVRSPGVFAMPLPRDMVRAAIAAKHDPHEIWTGGDSSTGYAGPSTFAFVAEVPYWDDPRTRDQSPSEQSLASILRDYVGWVRAADAVVGRFRDRLGNSGDEEIRLAFDETATLLPRGAARIERLLASGRVPDRSLSVANALLYREQQRLAALRAPALLLRLARGVPALRDAEAACDAYLDGALRAMRAETALEPVKLRSTVGVQAIAGLVAARAWATRGVTPG